MEVAWGKKKREERDEVYDGKSEEDHKWQWIGSIIRGRRWKYRLGDDVEPETESKEQCKEFQKIKEDKERGEEWVFAKYKGDKGEGEEREFEGAETGYREEQ